jgi:hypothetical protein
MLHEHAAMLSDGSILEGCAECSVDTCGTEQGVKNAKSMDRPEPSTAFAVTYMVESSIGTSWFCGDLCLVPELPYHFPDRGLLMLGASCSRPCLPENCGRIRKWNAGTSVVVTTQTRNVEIISMSCFSGWRR